MTGLLLVKNRGALHDHIIISNYVAGIVLKGNEVKAIREKKVGFEAAYIQIMHNEAFIVNMHIGEYSKQGKQSIVESTRRSRKLLLNHKEILEIERELSQKGRTAIPLAMVLVNNFVKLEFAVVKGKKEYEKKQTAKERQIKRDLDIAFKEVKRSLDT